MGGVCHWRTCCNTQVCCCLANIDPDVDESTAEIICLP